MYKLTTKIGLLKRVRRKPELAACALAALLFLSALAVPAQAQGTANTYGGGTVIHGGSIGLVPEQRVNVTVPSFYFAADGSVRFFKSLVLKVYDREGHAVTERTSGLVYSGESGGINEASHELGHIFTLSYGDLPVPGEPRTGRKEVWIEVQSISFSATQTPAEDISAVVLPPTVELIDDRTGRTVIFAMLSPAITKVGEIGAISGLTQAQLDSFYAFGGFYGGVSVGAAAGQTVRVVFRTTSDIPLLKPAGEPEVIVAAGPSPGGHVKVFDASSGALLWNRELSSLTAGLHTIDINRDELPAGGNSDNGRLQVYIELVLVEYQAGRGLAGLNVYPPIFEVFDNESSKTTVRGGIWKTTNFLTTDPVRSRPIVFTGLE